VSLANCARVGEDAVMLKSGEQEFAAVLAQATTPADRIAYAAGFIVGRLQRAGIDSVVVSGGAAVVLATARDFATLDIDLITPEGDRLDAALIQLGFMRRHPLQQIWTNRRLKIAVQVPASDLPAHSATEDVEAPTGEVVAIWSTTDLMLDRLAQAVYGNAPERLEQALALRDAAGADFDVERARQRAADEGTQMTLVLDAFLGFFDALPAEGLPDDEAYERARERFWAQIDALRHQG
jgi:hypothetical protein